MYYVCMTHEGPHVLRVMPYIMSPQVLDARDPLGSRAQAMEELILRKPDKKLVLVLNKVRRGNCLTAWGRITFSYTLLTDGHWLLVGGDGLSLQIRSIWYPRQWWRIGWPPYVGRPPPSLLRPPLR